MNKTGKIVVAAVSAIVAIAIIIGIVFAVIDVKNTKLSVPPAVDMDELLETEEVSHYNYYVSNLNVGGTSSIFLVFDNETGTFAYQSGTSTVYTGTYVQNGNEIIATTTSSSSETEMRFITDGKYIFFEDTIYYGEIPSGQETFNATCSHQSSDGDVYRYKFSSDGTYTVAWGDPADHTDTTTVDGEYSCDENGLITCTLNGNPTIPMYVYKNHLVATIYEGITDEEYDAQIEALIEAANQAE